jgi:flagellar biogenesis protein FliO
LLKNPAPDQAAGEGAVFAWRIFHHVIADRLLNNCSGFEVDPPNILSASMLCLLFCRGTGLASLFDAMSRRSVRIPFVLLILTTGLAVAQSDSVESGEDPGFEATPSQVVTSPAAPAGTPYHHAPALGWGQVAKSVGTVMAVLGLLVGVNLYIRRRAGQWKIAGGRRIRMVEQLAFDARRRLVLVEVGGRNVLLAVTPQQVTALTEWPMEGAAGEARAN